MYTVDENSKIFQTLPGDGWQALIKWCARYAMDGVPVMTLEPIVAWVTAKVSRKMPAGEYEGMIIAALVRSANCGADLVLLDVFDNRVDGFTLLAPGENLQPKHFRLLEGGHASGVTEANCV